MRREPHVRFCEGPGVQFPRATRLVEFASSRSALAPHLHASAEATNSYAHAAARTSPVTPTFPRLRPQNHLPSRAATLDVPTSRRA